MNSYIELEKIQVLIFVVFMVLKNIIQESLRMENL